MIEQQPNMRIVTLKDLWNIFIHRFWLMVLAAMLVSGGLLLFTHLTFVPRYESTATLYILKQDSADKNDSASDDFSLALKVVSDCDYLLKSHSVLDEVMEELNLDISYTELSKSVSTSNPENTRILEVTVESDSPKQAKRIVDSVCRIGTKKIEEAMGFNQVNLYEYGVLNEQPCNKTGLIIYMLVGIIAAIVVYTIFLIAFLLDDRIRSDEDIEKYLHLSILGDIPSADDMKKNHYGYYYGKSGTYGKSHQKKNRKKGL